MLKKLCIALGFGASALLGAAQAATLSGNLTVDDAFTAYLSTSDAVAGTALVSGTSWTSAQSFSATLNAGQTYYLHVAGRDVYGVISAFLGSFNLTPDAQFSNGTQFLVTNTTDWQVSATGFGNGYAAPNSLGANGANPWGNLGGIAPNAEWIWTGPGQLGEAYFSTKITVAAVPEPESYALMLTGLGLVGAVVRRRAQRGTK
jgi:PEP-CTERM motif